MSGPQVEVDGVQWGWQRHPLPLAVDGRLEGCQRRRREAAGGLCCHLKGTARHGTGSRGPHVEAREAGGGQPGVTSGTTWPSHLVGTGRPHPRSEDTGGQDWSPGSACGSGAGTLASHRPGLRFLIWTRFPRGLLRGLTARPPRPDRQEGPLPSPSPAGCQDLRTHRLQVVPRAGGEVAGHLHLPGLEHRGDEQSLSPQELAVHGPGAGVLREPSRVAGRRMGPVT